MNVSVAGGENKFIGEKKDMSIYNSIGKTYNQTRRADFRITNTIVRELKADVPATILDIGAGTGNYSYELAKLGYHVIALEPSEVMRNQGKQHENLTWIEGMAEKIPLGDQSVDGIICTLASHHFKNPSLCYSEMNRVLKKGGKMVIFTLDPRRCSPNCWLLDYFKPIIIESYNIHPPTDSLVDLIERYSNRPVQVIPFPLSDDLEDMFFFTGWKTPDIYLNEEFQAGTSPLAKGHEQVITECLTRLEMDLKSGVWHEKYGEIEQLDTYECGHMFLIV